MTKLQLAKDLLTTHLEEHAGAIALYFSGGSDSLLLLHILLEIEGHFSMVCFDHTFSRDQKKYLDGLIHKHDLRVFSYRPSNAYLIGNGKTVSAVEEYDLLGVGRMPFVKDVVHDPTRCAVEDVKFGPWHEGHAPVGFKLNIFGTRKTDRHYATGKAWKQHEWAVGPFHYLAPLWDWTRKEVKAALKDYGAEWPALDTGSLPMCLNCLCGKGQVFCPRQQSTIDAIDWDPQAMLAEFQRKHSGGSHVERKG